MFQHGPEGMFQVLPLPAYRLHQMEEHTQIGNESGFQFDTPERACVWSMHRAKRVLMSETVEERVRRAE
jgi:hypothetical protein